MVHVSGEQVETMVRQLASTKWRMSRGRTAGVSSSRLLARQGHDERGNQHRAVYQTTVLIWVWKHISADSVWQCLYMLRSKQKHLSGGALSHIVGLCAHGLTENGRRPAPSSRATPDVGPATWRLLCCVTGSLATAGGQRPLLTLEGEGGRWRELCPWH